MKSKQRAQVRHAQPKSLWDAESADGTLKANVRSFTVRDGLYHAQVERQITDRYVKMNIEGDVEKETEMLFLVQNFPLLAAGISEAEGFEVPLSEAVFWTLPEEFMGRLTEKVRAKNPQYSLPFFELKKMIFDAFQSTDEVMQDSILPSDKSDKSA